MGYPTHKPGGSQVFDFVKVKESKIQKANVDELNVKTTNNTSGVTERIVVVPIPDVHEDASTVDTTFEFPAKAIVKEVYLDVTTEEVTATTEQLNVGVTGNNDGFLDSVDVSSDGLVKGTLADGAITLGDLLFTHTDTASNPVHEPDITSGGKKVNVTPAGADFEELKGNIIIIYLEVT